MSTELVVLALLMAAATYPSRAIPLLAPGMSSLPPAVLAYLRLVGPATLAALAAANAVVTAGEDGQTRAVLGIELVAVLVTVAVVAWRRNLLLGIAAAVVVVAAVRAAGLG